MKVVAEKEKDVVISEEKMEETVSEEKTEEVLETEAEKETEEEASDAPEEADEESARGAEKAGREKEKKGFRKKNREEKKTDALNEKIGELEDKVKRQLAEFENFRNRTEKEKSAMFEVGAKSVIEKMLPVVDNFERGLSGLSEEEKEGAFAAGMQMVYKQLLTELDNLGVKPIEAVGKEFDPNLHNAVMQVESEEYESGIVAQEMMKGYTYRDAVVRHSMVAVVS
ncbi:MAG: nucleotide exchange factor GrpE [Lachnospiraceae bacterium]|nr:nucleotide exchange factor GrpE [Lachnospiraceae bacterium]